MAQKTLTFWMSEELHDALALAALQRGKARAVIVRELLRKEFATDENVQQALATMPSRTSGRSKAASEAVVE